MKSDLEYKKPSFQQWFLYAHLVMGTKVSGRMDTRYRRLIPMESSGNGEAIRFWNLEKLKLRGTEMGDIAADSWKNEAR